MKSTFNYVLNDLALSSLVFRVIDSNEVASEQDKIDLKYQIELLKQENQQLKEQLKKTLPTNEYKKFEELKEELGNKYDKFMYDMNLQLYEQLKQRDEIIDEAIKYIKGNTCWELRTSELLEILQKYKGDNNE